MLKKPTAEQASIFYSDMEQDNSTTPDTPPQKPLLKLESLDSVTQSICTVKIQEQYMPPKAPIRRKCRKPIPKPALTLPLVPKFKQQLTFKDQLDNPDQHVCQKVIPSSLSIHCMQPPYDFNTDYNIDKKHAIKKLWNGQIPRSYVIKEESDKTVTFADMCHLYYGDKDPSDLQYSEKPYATDNQVYRCAFLLIQHDLRSRIKLKHSPTLIVRARQHLLRRIIHDFIDQTSIDIYRQIVAGRTTARVTRRNEYVSKETQGMNCLPRISARFTSCLFANEQFRLYFRRIVETGSFKLLLLHKCYEQVTTLERSIQEIARDSFWSEEEKTEALERLKKPMSMHEVSLYMKAAFQLMDQYVHVQRK